MSAIGRLLREGRKIHRTTDGRLWLLQRINESDLALHGHALDMAAEHAKLILAEVLLEEEETRPKTDVERAKAEQVAEMSEEAKAEHDRKIGRLQNHRLLRIQQKALERQQAMHLRDPGAISKTHAAQDAFVIAGVVGIADPAELDGLDPKAELVPTRQIAEERDAEALAQWKAECEATGMDVPKPPPVQAVQCEPLHLVADEKAEQLARGILHIGRIGGATRAELAIAVRELAATSPSEVLRSFRKKRTPLHRDREDGPDVPATA